MRVYLLSALIASSGVAMLAGAAVVAHNHSEPDPAAIFDREAVDRGLAGDGRGGSVWGASYFPNVPLITHEGETVRFFSDLLEDKVVLINFIYTSCPDTCPMETARLLEVANLLGDRLGDDVFFYSITIDPENDTVETLGDYAASWGIPDGWWFLTGEPEDLITVREKLGVSIEDIETLNFAAHPIHLVMGNQATGRWMKRSPFENSHVVADQLGRWLHNWKAPPPKGRDYADAPEIRQISDGETLFRTHCAACHTIGGGDLDDVARWRVGPDLYQVSERRDRAWLERWLYEPDVMLEEGDPVATAMLEQYSDIPMPNLRLSREDVEMLLGYIDTESRRIADLRSGGDDPHRHHRGHGTRISRDEGGDGGHRGMEGGAGREGDSGHERHAGEPAERSAP